MKVKAWHFLREDKKTQFEPRQKVRVGQVLKVDGEPVMCARGLHASLLPLDALAYAPGPVICRVEVGGIIARGDDKLAGTERKVLWMADATETLGAFSRWCALEVVHLWEPPEVVVEYLKTGDKSKRAAAGAAARAAAWAAAWDAEWDAARAAAGAAARAAERAAAWAAEWDAAWAAARAAEWDAAWDAARAAAGAAAWAAEAASAGAAERAAAGAAAWAAEREKQNHKLNSMLMKLNA